MKKIFVCLISLVVLSCSFDDENLPIMDPIGISFNLNGIDYLLTDYSAVIDPTNNVNRIVEASFDRNSKTIRFSVLVEETNQMDELILIENGISHISDPIYGNRETSITTHTDSKMEGTFRVTFEDTVDEPIFTFTDGIINIEY